MYVYAFYITFPIGKVHETLIKNVAYMLQK
jgi:hypothetical protein